VLLEGCAAPSESGFNDVATVSAKQLGDKELVWNRGGPEDAKATEAIKTLLESPLNIDSAVQIALLNNKDLQAAYEDLGVAQADLVQAGLLQNPVFSADLLYINGNAPVFAVVQDFVGLLTLGANKRIASTAFDRIKDETSFKVIQLAADVRAAFYKLVADEQSLDLFRKVVEASEAAADLAARQRRAGNLNAREQALQQQTYAGTMLDLARAEAQFADDREAFNRLLGLWGDDIAWNLPQKLPDVPMSKRSSEGLEEAAVSQRFDLAAAKRELDRASQAHELGTSTRFLGAIGIGFVFSRDETDNKFVKGPRLEFALPLFDQGQAKIAGLEAELRRRDKLLAGLEVGVRSQVRAAWKRLAAAQDVALHYQTVMLPLSQTIVAETQRSYNGMLVGVYDLLLSRQNEINTARDYIAAVRDYWVARSDLERALGGPLPDGAVNQQGKAAIDPSTAGRDDESNLEARS